MEAILVVTEHLGLPAGEAPTMAQFDQAADELGLGWSSSRVVRVWERWRLAVEVFKGERDVGGLAGRDFHAAQDRSRRNLEDSVRGVKLWLRSRPPLETGAAYDEFAKVHNANRAPADKRLRSSRSVSGALRLYWPSVLAVARGDISLISAREQELAALLPRDTTEAILALPGVARLLKRSELAVRKASEASRQFPIPVAVIGGRRAWLYGDVKLYKRGLACPKRSKGELQFLYMDTPELSARLKLSTKAFQRRVRDKRWDLVPRPEGAVAAGVPYWLRAKVEDWLRVKGKAELTPEQEDEISIANARRAAAIGASLKAAQQPGRRRRRKKKA